MSCRNFNSLYLILISSLLMLSACQSGPDDAVAPDGQCTVTFSVTNYRQMNFDDISASQTTRAEQIVMDLNNLSLTVFDAETNKQVGSTILHVSKDYHNSAKEAREFPKFSLTLPYGHYRVLVLGFNGSRACNIVSPKHISWADDYVPNTFLSYDEFTLDDNSELQHEVTLRRVVSAFCVTAEEAIPAELKAMRFSADAGGVVLDATTGFATESTGRTSDIIVPADNIGEQNLAFTSFLFLPKAEITTDYTVQAIGEGNAVLNEIHFAGVPLRINYLTEWTGKVFEGGSVDVTPGQTGFGIKWDTDYADTIRLVTETTESDAF